jgi:formate dehydrogenase assembly factor FdhD
MHTLFTAGENYRPVLTNAGPDAAMADTAVDESGRPRAGHVACERPLTIYLDKREIVTLMTLGTHPELLVLSWLRNQRLLRELADIRAVQVDRDTDSAAVTTRGGAADLEQRLARKTGVTLIARAKGAHFLVYHGADNVPFDAIPAQAATPGGRDRQD